MKIISCIEAVERLFELLDRAITPQRKKELDNHVAVCRDCCNRMEFEQLLREKVAAVAKTEPAPSRLVERVEKLLQQDGNFSSPKTSSSV